jgi:hypothetical protein
MGETARRSGREFVRGLPHFRPGGVAKQRDLRRRGRFRQKD